MKALTSSEARPKSKPLWQMDLRRKLGLEPGRNDTYSRLLMAHLYGSDNAEEMAERIEFDIGELQRALRIVREND